MSDEAVVIRGPEEIRRYRHLAIIHALALEIVTGLTHRRGQNPLKAAQDDGLTTKRTKKGALKDVVAFAHKTYGYEPGPQVLKALNK